MLKVLDLSARGVIRSEIEVLKLRDLNLSLDRVMKGDVLGKLVVEIAD
jgi:D-arabinose 1-dehydrogenase-like Zn-dependent alcohol dehydrogenase